VRDETIMPRRCTCDRYRPSQPWTVDQCHLCWKYAHDPEYRTYCGGDSMVYAVSGKAEEAKDRTKDCVFLGGSTGEALECPTCAGTVKIKKFHCQKHGSATLRKHIAGHACCALCPDYSDVLPDPFTGAVTRHLLYHLYPRREHYGNWQKNVSELLRRIEIFNGRRIVAIVTNPDLVDPEEVKRRFLHQVEEFITLPNDPNFREVKTWIPLWEALGDDASGENTITFHAHSKGTQWSPNPFERSSVLWGEMMYEACLDYLPLVERMLQQFPLAGAFKMLGDNIGDCKYKWHYPGSFVWIRNKHCPPEKWRNIPQTWWGTEAWPGNNWPRSESGAILLAESNVDLYKHSYIEQTAYPALERFRREYQHSRSSA
jgi:hypothetical protein